MDFENLVQLSKDIGAKFVNVVANKITGNAEIVSPLSLDDYKHLIHIIRKEKDSHYITIQRCYDILLSQVAKYPQSILSGCQAGISVCAITLDNKYMPCLHLMYPEKFDSISEYWKLSKTLQKLRYKDGVNQGYCSDCNHNNNCYYCRAMSIESHNDFNSGLKGCGFKEVYKEYEIIEI